MFPLCLEWRIFWGPRLTLISSLCLITATGREKSGGLARFKSIPFSIPVHLLYCFFIISGPGGWQVRACLLLLWLFAARAAARRNSRWFIIIAGSTCSPPPPWWARWFSKNEPELDCCCSCSCCCCCCGSGGGSWLDKHRRPGSQSLSSRQ